jgi:hypothetical protein
MNYCSIKYNAIIASAASACIEIKNVDTPIEINNNINIAGIATYCFNEYPNTQNAINVIIPAITKWAVYL